MLSLLLHFFLFLMSISSKLHVLLRQLPQFPTSPKKETYSLYVFQIGLYIPVASTSHWCIPYLQAAQTYIGSA